jgi:predicted MFS family arabinose efflux permease
MTQRQMKCGYFVLEGLNAFATSLYFFYLFFFFQREFDFGNLGNLFVSALNGFVYVPCAWYAGKFAAQRGYFTALGLGFATMLVFLVIGLFLSTAGAHLGCMVGWTVGMCFTWPVLESLASEGESPRGMRNMIGIYNLVWAGFSALAYFTGGAIIERLGSYSIFWLPALLHVLQLPLLWFLHRQLKHGTDSAPRIPVAPVNPAEEGLNPRPIALARTFLRMAWLANPFAYVAINTLTAVIPGLAADLKLSPTFAGFFCSIWFFVRWLTFLSLWLWSGWHYQARWFFGAFALLILSFATILLAPRLSVVIAAQITFGFAVGLIYYSSLFYSMDASSTKSEHGGIHEAAIGLGIFVGPAVGATSLRVFPEFPRSGAIAVSILLCAGLASLCLMWRRGGARKTG